MSGDSRGETIHRVARGLGVLLEMRNSHSFWTLLAVWSEVLPFQTEYMYSLHYCCIQVNTSDAHCSRHRAPVSQPNDVSGTFLAEPGTPLGLLSFFVYLIGYGLFLGNS